MICDLSTSDKIAVASGAASFVVSLAALGLALYALYRSNRNTSASTLVALNVAFRASWWSFLNATKDEDKQFELAELLNLVEIACAICQENSLAGNSRDLMRAYLNTILNILINNQGVSVMVRTSLLEDKKTFLHIKRFIRNKPSYLSVTIPAEWYQTV
jgi:hypothetical protein